MSEYICPSCGKDCENHVDWFMGHSSGDCMKFLQVRINQLEQKLALAVEALGFYGDPESYIKRNKDTWSNKRPEENEHILNYKHPERDWVGTISVGGKRARQVLAQLREQGEVKIPQERL